MVSGQIRLSAKPRPLQCARVGERMAVMGDVPERLCGEGDRVERVDPCEELVIDHAALDEDALRHRVDCAEHLPVLAGAQQVPNVCSAMSGRVLSLPPLTTT